MSTRYVLDTCAVLSYFSSIVKCENSISQKSLHILEQGFAGSSSLLFTIPSVVFLEIYEKWCRTEELTQKIKYEIIIPILDSPNVEIRELDKEVLSNVFKIKDSIENLEAHDKIVLSSAITLNSPLITSDQKIINYFTQEKIIPAILQ